MIDIELLELVKQGNNLINNKQLADFLSLDPSTICKIRKGERGIGGKVYRAIINKCPEVLINYNYHTTFPAP